METKEAIEFLKQKTNSKNKTELAKELGISPHRLYNWQRDGMPIFLLKTIEILNLRNSQQFPIKAHF